MTATSLFPKDLTPLYMIEYPGFAKNNDRALATLGGTEAIEKAFKSQNNRLELKFRVSDPLAHSTQGDLRPKKCLVLRIRQSKSNQASSESKFSFEVLGKIQNAFQFDTLAEFQWLPMQRTNTTDSININDILNGVNIHRSPESLNPKYVSVLDDVLPIKSPFDSKLRNFNPDAQLLILPALFSRFDTAREIHQPHPKFRSKEMRAEFERQQSMSIIGKTRKKRSTMSYLLNYGNPVPDKPPEKLVKERESMSLQEQTITPILVRCFERQKVWSKAALCLEINCSPTDIKYILPLHAFHYQTGPFRTLWVKYGYDPHKDTSSKTLQALDFRVKNQLDQQEYSRRSINQYQIPLRKNPITTNKARSSAVDLKTVISQGVSNDIDFDDNFSTMKNATTMEAMCKFRKGTIPAARQLTYQLKDIELPEVQAIIHANDGSEPVRCSERDGWLSSGSIDRIRKIMTRTLSETLGSSAIFPEGNSSSPIPSTSQQVGVEHDDTNLLYEASI